MESIGNGANESETGGQFTAGDTVTLTNTRKNTMSKSKTLAKTGSRAKIPDTKQPLPLDLCAELLQSALSYLQETGAEIGYGNYPDGGVYIRIKHTALKVDDSDLSRPKFVGTVTKNQPVTVKEGE